MSRDASSPHGVENEPLDLHVVHERDGEHDVLRVSGELDLPTTPVLRSAVEDLVARGAPAVLLEMTEVGFMDSSGIALLIELAGRVPVRIVAASAPVRRLIAMAGLESVIPVLPVSP